MSWSVVIGERDIYTLMFSSTEDTRNASNCPIFTVLLYCTVTGDLIILLGGVSKEFMLIP